MTQYLNKKFSVPCKTGDLTDSELEERWNLIFSKKYICEKCQEKFHTEGELEDHKCEMK